tara:strand:+ start:4026 stop:5327 length:1302 start_codon:yes stop_codon:yes gene_type:complete
MGLYKFGPDDVFHNVIETHPSSSFFIYEGQRFYNDSPPISGTARKGNDPGAPPSFYTNAPPGYVNLYELNINRFEGEHLYGTDTKANLAKNKSLIFPFTVKGQNNRVTFKTVSDYNTRPKIPDENIIFTGSYPMTASIAKIFYPSTTFKRSGSFVGALKNTLNHYTHLSPHYEFSSSHPGTAIGGATACRDFSKIDIGIVDIPSVFYGSALKKGTVRLKFFVSGTVIGELNDENKNGELIQVGPVDSPRSGSVAGVVLYNEGVVVLTGSYELLSHGEDYDGDGNNETPSWIYFASTISGTGDYHVAPFPSTPSSSYMLDFEGVHRIPTLTMFAHASKGMLNHSNNPTYIKYGEYATGSITTGSDHYIEPTDRKIKNIVSASYSDPTGSFEKVTYVSKIGIYDKHKNLIGIAKTATPIKKTLERDLTFKLKLDL